MTRQTARRPYGRRDGNILCPCWCEEEMLLLTQQDILEGRTFSCGREDCHP